MVSTSSINTLIFDWDGTLVDSAELGLNAFKKTFAELEVEFPMDLYEANYSPNWYSTYQALGLPKEKWQLADDLWLQHYGASTAKLIEGVGEVLMELSRRNYRLAVVSSGSEARVCREIAGSVLADAFDTVICNEQIVNKKPDPEGLNLALDRLGCSAREAAYVGDAPEDIQMGKAANVLTVGVRSEYPSSSRLLAEVPDIYVESLGELGKWFRATS